MADIRVCVRFRPANSEEDGESICISRSDRYSFTLKDEKDELHKFSFDKVFYDDSEQSDVYDFLAQPIVTDVLNAINGTIITYGQTGAGKSYTMEGENILETDNRKKGLLPRVVDELFEAINLSGEAAAFEVKLSMVKIYMENVRDLFDLSKNIQVNEHTGHGIMLRGVTEILIRDGKEALNFLSRGIANRAVGETLSMTSSRSHCIYIFTVQKVVTNWKRVSTGNLVLVDLAGSEKVEKTGAEGRVLEEVKIFDESLSALRDAIDALISSQQGKAHQIPYFESQLTRILQDALGESSQTALLCCCSPSLSDSSESLFNLRFGARVKHVMESVRIICKEEMLDQKQEISSSLADVKLKIVLHHLQRILKKFQVYMGTHAPTFAGFKLNGAQDFVRPTSYSLVSDETYRQNGVSSTPVCFPSYHASLEQVLLQPEEDLLNKIYSELAVQGVLKNPQNTHGTLKVEVQNVKMGLHVPTGCTNANNNVKCGIVAESIAYELVLEAAMKVQEFQQRNLLLRGPWKWLVTEFASYYGVSDAYTKLRYLQYVMDVATPTAYCLNVVHDLLSQVMMGKSKGTLSSVEKRMLGMLSNKIEQTIALVFENYKNLDESLPSGLSDTQASCIISPALTPALKLYALLHDISSQEAQLQLYKYFQTAVRKILGRHLAEANVFISSIGEKSTVAYSMAYKKMNSLCLSIRQEIVNDITIHNQAVLPRFLDLPKLSTALYSFKLCNSIHAFLIACPPVSLANPVSDLITTTCDFHKDLVCWKLSPVKGGVDSKELFHIYITHRIKVKYLELLEACKREGVGQQNSKSTFVDNMYEKLRETFDEFEVILHLWPDYTLVLEKVIADFERAIIGNLEKQYSDILSSLRENTIPVKAVKYVQSFVKGNTLPYTFPDELGTLFNSMKKMLDVLQPEMRCRFKSHSSCISKSEITVPGDLLNEVTVLLRLKLRKYLQAAVKKIAGHTRLQHSTNLKKIIVKAKSCGGESEIRHRMQPLKDMLTSIISDLHAILEVDVFFILCQDLWGLMGQDVLRLLERKKNWSYKPSQVVLNVLNETFSSEMQRTLYDKDMEPPRSIQEAELMLCSI